MEWLTQCCKLHSSCYIIRYLLLTHTYTMIDCLWMNSKINYRTINQQKWRYILPCLRTVPPVANKVLIIMCWILLQQIQQFTGSSSGQGEDDGTRQVILILPDKVGEQPEDVAALLPTLGLTSSPADCLSIAAVQPKTLHHHLHHHTTQQVTKATSDSSKLLVSIHWNNLFWLLAWPFVQCAKADFISVSFSSKSNYSG